ncbi:MAG: hypothetical protein Roseis2KO_24940 [Roseivirga sp.]
MSKLNPNGSLNEIFSIGSGFDGDIFKLISLSTDKLLVVGSFATYNGVATGPMVQINEDGSLDGDFMKATGIESPSQNPIANVIELPNGKLLVYGKFMSYNGFATNSMVILNADGTVDESFSHEDEEVLSVSQAAPQSSGKIVISIIRANSQQGLIVRLNADGTKDEAFNDVDTGTDTVYKIMAQSTDKLLVLSDTSEGDQPHVALFRLNADGTSDESFDLGSGILGFFDDFQVNQEDEIFIGSSSRGEEGGSIDGNLTGLISRLEADGAFGSSFASRLSGDSSRVALGKQNEVAIYGRFLRVEDHVTRGIALFNNDEVSDTDFVADVRGVAETSIVTDHGGGYTYLVPRNSEEIDSMGRVGLFLNNQGLFQRSIDIEIDIPEITVFKPVGVGVAVAGGPVGSEPIFRVLTDDTGFVFNSEDYRFNNNWVNEVRGSSFDDIVFAAGSFSGYNGITDGVAGIVRFGIGGAAGAGRGDVDHSFVSPFRADSVNITDFKYRSDNGQVIVVGVFTPADSEEAGLINGIARLNYDGSFDETFDWSNHFSGGIIQHVEIVEDGYIIVGGFTEPRKGIAKINNNGSLNTEFNADDSFLFDKIAGAQVFEGAIYVGGDLSEYQGQKVYGLMKLDLDGNLDDGFKLPNTLSAKVNDIDIDRNHIINLAGLFYDSLQNRKLSAVRLGFGPDAAPTNLRLNSVTYDMVSLSWDESSTNEDFFRVEISVNDSFDSPVVDSAPANTTDYNIATFESGRTYYYRVAAIREFFKSEYSNTVEVVVPQRPLAAPTELNGVGGYQRVGLWWKETTLEEHGFVIERSENDQQNFIAIDSVGPNVTGFEDLTVDWETTYFYRVRAYKGSEYTSDYSNVKELVTEAFPVSTPTGVTATIETNGITLRWDAQSFEYTSYVLERSKNSPDDFRALVNTTLTLFADQSTDGPATYYYRLRAKWNNFISEYSDTVEIEVPWNLRLRAPGDLTGTVISMNQIDLSWTDNSFDEDNFVIARKVNQEDFETIASVPVNQTTYSDTGVDAAQTLEYVVWASNSGGDSPPSDTLRIVIANIGEGHPGHDNRFDFSYDPITNDLSFKLNSPSDKIRGYQVVSSRGVMKMREEGLKTQQLNLNLSENPAGVYLLHVISERDKYVVKFLKN